MSTKSLQANPFFFLWIQLAGFLFSYPSAIGIRVIRKHPTNQILKKQK